MIVRAFARYREFADALSKKPPVQQRVFGSHARHMLAELPAFDGRLCAAGLRLLRRHARCTFIAGLPSVDSRLRNRCGGEGEGELKRNCKGKVTHLRSPVKVGTEPAAAIGSAGGLQLVAQLQKAHGAMLTQIKDAAARKITGHM